MIIPATLLGKLGISASVGLMAGLVAVEEVALDSTTARWAAIGSIAVTAGFVSQIVLQVMARMDASKAAQKVQEVADKQAKDVTAQNHANVITGNKLDTIHTLVNSSYGVQLRLTAAALRRVADGKDATEEDKQAANEAERLYKEHIAKQDAVDAKEKP